MAIFSRC